MKRAEERGIALGVVVITAVMFSIAAFAILTVSMGGAQQAGSYSRRLQARYAAEAGLVWAMQQLWGNPTWSDAAGDADLTVGGAGGMNVDVILPACPALPASCDNRQLKAKVTY